jgi:type IV pilus assembly protein PilQ
VPVILIEVIIMYVNKSKSLSTGIQVGLGKEPAVTGGTVLPGVDMTLGSESINRIFDEMGWVNLGKVTPNFYVSLKAMEEQGFVDLESTPKISTLNGTEATLSIGNTEYYLEEQSNLYGAQNPQLTTSQTYKAIDAELKLKIKPVVSDNGQITLDIEVSQSDFTERISKTAPPGSVNRNFTSKIRVKDQEMILLGGLTDKKKSDSGSGTPFLSRIPVIKWFFSSRTKENSESKLSVLIKPTIIN